MSNERVTSARVELSEDELVERNAVLRRKKRGTFTVLVIFFLTCGFPLWFLQTQEKADATTLWSVTAILSFLLLIGVLCFRIFTRQIDRDLQENENILVEAVIMEGWQTNERRDPELLVNIGNDAVRLSIATMKRLVADVRDLDRMLPGSRLIVEMTPHARVMVRIIRDDGL